MSELGTSLATPQVGAPRLPPLAGTVLRGFLKLLGALACAAAAFGILLLIWGAVWLASGKEFPTPASTWAVFTELLSKPFYDNGPNDKGIGLQLTASLKRVFTGFLLGSAVAIPVGTVMGAVPLINRVVNPLVQILRPVSPLAWFPLGLATLKNAENATVFAIFITSLWPTLINTTFGVSSVPKEYIQVSQVFNFSPLRYFRKILLPFALPHILTGLRLSMGVAWMVIVAGEMLSGGTGIGFWVWDSWNALNLDRVLSGIFFIGLVGLVLDRGFDFLHKKVTHAA